MNKGIIIGMIAVVIVVITGVGGYFWINHKNKTNEQADNSAVNDNVIHDNVNQDDKAEEDRTTSSTGKILVVYFSASGSTKRVAEEISQNLNADLFEIVPENVYTSADLDWTDENSRVSKEHEDESLRNVELKNTEVGNWDHYDTIIIGYPIWWGIAAWPVDTFVKANDFSGKTVIPFCTSASSGLGESGNLLKELANSGNWKEGYRFRSGVSSSDIKIWTDRLK